MKNHSFTLILLSFVEYAKQSLAVGADWGIRLSGNGLRNSRLDSYPCAGHSYLRLQPVYEFYNLQYLKGGQKKGLVCVHECCDNFYLTIKEEELVERLGANPDTDFITCPVKAGGVIFFSNMVPHRSVPNRSDHIRFAMDLRYQSPNRPWGFFAKSSGILLRSPSKPDHVPDWEFYSTQGRYEIIKDLVIEKTGQGEKDDEFDTTLNGPHMDRWKIVNHSVHTEAYFKGKAEEQKT